MNKLILASSILVAAAGLAAAEPAPAAPDHGFAGAKVGGIVPFDGLSPFVAFGVEGAVILPALDRQLAIAVDVDDTQPTKTGGESDPRVAGGAYTWKLTEQELAIMPVVMYRMTSRHAIVPFAGIGPRLLLAKSTVGDDGMPTLAKTTERSTRLGVGVPLGVELPVGPGHAIAELLLQYGTLNHVATGDANTGAASLALGYRLLF